MVERAKKGIFKLLEAMTGQTKKISRLIRIGGNVLGGVECFFAYFYAFHLPYRQAQQPFADICLGVPDIKVIGMAGGPVIQGNAHFCNIATAFTRRMSQDDFSLISDSLHEAVIVIVHYHLS